MAERTTSKDVDRLAATCNVHVAHWAPGDGMTRYRFIAIDGNHTSLDYFGASGSDVLGTCLGAREAYTWLQGYRACQLTREQPVSPIFGTPQPNLVRA